MNRLLCLSKSNMAVASLDIGDRGIQAFRKLSFVRNEIEQYLSGDFEPGKELEEMKAVSSEDYLEAIFKASLKTGVKYVIAVYIALCMEHQFFV